MTAQEIRRKYIQFFEARGHTEIPRALIVPQGEAGVLFTGSGMQPLIPYLLGEKHPKGVRLVDSQTCLRSQDIEEVGDNRHTTFFEMLGNWSLGDYFKQDQLPWFFEFIVEEVGLSIENIYVTAFSGDEEYDLPKDEASANLWQGLFNSKDIDAEIVHIGSEEDGYKRGMKPNERIFYYDSSKNWWAPEGEPSKMSVGQPGGPDSEVFYLFDEVEHDPKWGEHCHPNCDCGRFMEIGNSVFMEYIRTESGFEKLPKQNVDFGGGLERIAAAKIGSSDVFKISLLWPIIDKLERLSGKKYVDATEEMRVIADHLRGAMFLAVDGVKPSNKEQGYVMRRLMRRAILKAFNLGIEQNFVEEIAPVISGLYKDDFPDVAQKESEIIAILAKEEKAFKQTLRNGLRAFEAMMRTRFPNGQRQEVNTGTELHSPGDWKSVITGKEIFKLHDTYGFPKEISLEEAQRRGIVLELNWQEEFDNELKEQRERSQTAAKGAFKGGLGGQSLIHKKYHTATHLMYQALREVLGDHVVQHGSNITEDRLRFDFSHHEKMTDEQKSEVEKIVNEQISKDLKVSFAEYPTEEARGPLGALGQFGDRYGDTVKVYKMIADNADRPFSFEICGGPHVEHTLQLFEDGKKFKIQKEQSSSAGIRRIKAVLV
ncbi:alanine--tRNA ligase [Candidatus Saccharibacteria bacterium]|nr:alanine--tRNA ligase [Candidatus Saccharibacteria bacterium]